LCYGHRIPEMQSIDLGFRICLNTTLFKLPEYPEGTIIKVESKNGKPIFIELMKDIGIPPASLQRPSPLTNPFPLRVLRASA
jgi:hypothetical protein